jgi:hypothetical protein
MEFRNFDHRFFSKRIIFILTYFKNTIRASGYAITTTIAFICVNDDEVIA